ncbi:MAG: hypothetical protein IKU83_00285 [Lachnospiraceae bacterium]|nr:hypothetical protein [Lachnospiraceae bacterium]
MEEFYRLIEEKIERSGYPEKINGREFYDDVCEQADEQELGMFLCLIKKSDTVTYEVRLENLKNQIDLKTLLIRDGEQTYFVDFDAE